MSVKIYARSGRKNARRFVMIINGRLVAGRNHRPTTKTQRLRESIQMRGRAIHF